MVDFNVFFPEGARLPQPLQGHGFLIHGARASGKTSLAYEAAIQTVRAGGQVVVLCVESALYAKVPQPFTPLKSLPQSVLSRIEFIYVDGWSTALRELMAFRLVREVPELLLIDDDGFTEANVARLAERPPSGFGFKDHSMLHRGLPASMAACLSFLENMYSWVTRNGRSVFYTVVTNDVPDGSTQLPLPFTAFPLVNVWFGASGLVQVTPSVGDPAVVKPVQLCWDRGLSILIDD